MSRTDGARAQRRTNPSGVAAPGDDSDSVPAGPGPWQARIGQGAHARKTPEARGGARPLLTSIGVTLGNLSVVEWIVLNFNAKSSTLWASGLEKFNFFILQQANHESASDAPHR